MPIDETQGPEPTRADWGQGSIEHPTRAGSKPAPEDRGHVGRPSSIGLRFCILGPHARGGLGEVYIANDEELHRTVALKQIQEQFADDPDSRSRFLREAEITGALEHPGVVPVYGLGRYSDGRPYYAMRFIQGESLRDAIKRFHDPSTAERSSRGERAVELRQLLDRFLVVCNTIAYAHSRGILHRDIKPSNVMLGAFGETLVVDWGLAKHIGSPAEAPCHGGASFARTPSGESWVETVAGSALGTPQYMSPEQAGGNIETLGAASDVYSLGATLYCLLTGRPPFPDVLEGGCPELLRKVEQGEFDPPRAVVATIPRALEAVCLKAMARDPNDRYATATALADDLEHWLADEPVAAWNEPLSARLWRWARTHQTAVSVGAVAFIVATIGAAVSMNIEHLRQRDARVFLVSLQKSCEADDRLARAELSADRFEEAQAVLKEAVDRLDDAGALPDLRARLAARLDRVRRLVEFRRQADEAERLELQIADAEADAAATAGLTTLGVFAHPDWWEHLPADDLSPAQLEQLREDAYRQLVLLAGIRAKGGLPPRFGTAQAAPYLRKALEPAEAALRFRPTDQSARLIELFSRVSLGEVQPRMEKAAREPVSAADYYFMGVLHLFAAEVPDDIIPALAARLLAGRFGLDAKTPLATAERYLRTAAALDPSHYWTNIWLGDTLVAAGRPDAAELVFNQCTALRPTEALGYASRGSALVSQAMKAKKADVMEREAARALADLDRAVALSPDDPYIHWIRSNSLFHLGRHEKALAATDLDLDLEPPLRVLQGWSVADQSRLFKQTAKHLEEAAGRDSKNPETWANLARVHLALGQDDKALQFADRALGLRTAEARALAVRGWVALGRGRLNDALADLEASLAARPDSYLARIGHALALERLGRDREALADYEELEKLARTRWQKREAQEGRDRLAAKTKTR